jgi:hypothetical protein
LETSLGSAKSLLRYLFCSVGMGSMLRMDALWAPGLCPGLKLTVGPCLDTDVLESMLTMEGPFETACVHIHRTKQITFDLTLERSSCLLLIQALGYE